MRLRRSGRSPERARATTVRTISGNRRRADHRASPESAGVAAGCEARARAPGSLPGGRPRGAAAAAGVGGGHGAPEAAKKTGAGAAPGLGARPRRASSRRGGLARAAVAGGREGGTRSVAVNRWAVHDLRGVDGLPSIVGESCLSRRFTVVNVTSRSYVTLTRCWPPPIGDTQATPGALDTIQVSA